MSKHPGALFASYRHCFRPKSSASMASFVRFLTTIFFVASMSISLALAVYSGEWSEERADVLREARTVANGLAIAGFCMTLFIGKKRSRARR